MKKKNMNQKLSLKKETISRLDSAQMNSVVGASLVCGTGVVRCIIQGTLGSLRTECSAIFEEYENL